MYYKLFLKVTSWKHFMRNCCKQNQYTVGAYDVNSFGKHIEVGFFWFRKSRLMGFGLLIGSHL